MATKKSPRKPAASPRKPRSVPLRATAAVDGAVLPAMQSAVRPKGAPAKFRARVRMYRHGLGDCFLLTIPRGSKRAFQILIDCGALARDKVFMQSVVGHVRDSVRGKGKGKARLDVVVGTHEHKDHLSGFNQARQLFNDDFEFGAVWLAWTENLTNSQIRRLKETKKRVASSIAKLAATPRFAGMVSEELKALAGFSTEDDSTGDRTVEQALAYLKQRGEAAGDLRYLEPGTTFGLDEVPDVRVYVLGPPRDGRWLKTSAVTEKMKRDHVVYHLDGRTGVGLDALAAALEEGRADLGHPFGQEHRMRRSAGTPAAYSPVLDAFIAKTYDKPDEQWRRIDSDWLGAFNQLALDMDNDTNNTSLVLAFEFGDEGEVLLFVADAQIGSWLSWSEVKFKRPGGGQALTATDLLARTTFYKVGHHCSHNATARSQGLELMTHPQLTAFIPLDCATAKKQGANGGWAMPAPPLYKALKAQTRGRVVMSDVTDPLSPEARKAGVVATDDYIDFYLK